VRLKGIINYLTSLHILADDIYHQFDGKSSRDSHMTKTRVLSWSFVYADNIAKSTHLHKAYTAYWFQDPTALVIKSFVANEM
jgi:hypothetical protein